MAKYVSSNPTVRYWASVREQAEREEGERLHRLAVINRSQRERKKTLRSKSQRRQKQELRDERLQRLLKKLSSQLDLVRKSHKRKGKPR